MRDLHARRYATVAAAHEAGIPVYCGTDAGGSLGHGRVADEVLELAAAGLPPAAALSAASWGARAWLGREGLTEGAQADLVVLGRRPAQDLRPSGRPTHVVLRAAWSLGADAYPRGGAFRWSRRRRQRRHRRRGRVGAAGRGQRGGRRGRGRLRLGGQRARACRAWAGAASCWPPRPGERRGCSTSSSTRRAVAGPPSGWCRRSCPVTLRFAGADQVFHAGWGSVAVPGASTATCTPCGRSAGCRCATWWARPRRSRARAPSSTPRRPR
jgi:hypothetical protein